MEWPQTPADQRAHHQLWRDARAGKEQLSRHATADLHIPIADTTVHVTRDEFETAARPHRLDHPELVVAEGTLHTDTTQTATHTTDGHDKTSLRGNTTAAFDADTQAHTNSGSVRSSRSERAPGPGSFLWRLFVHPILTIRALRARWRGRAGDPASAATALEQLLTDELRVLGPDHPDTLTTRDVLAGGWHDQGRLDEAAREFQDVLTIRRRTQGDDHPQTQAVRRNLDALG